MPSAATPEPQLKQVFDALRELLTPPEPPKRPIGFVNPENRGKRPQATGRIKVKGIGRTG